MPRGLLYGEKLHQRSPDQFIFSLQYSNFRKAASPSLRDISCPSPILTKQFAHETAWSITQLNILPPTSQSPSHRQFPASE